MKVVLFILTAYMALVVVCGFAVLAYLLKGF